MRTKIFVCSTSGIDYVSHSPNISSIPVILRFSDEESYEDYTEMTTDAFYQRITIDKYSTVTPEFQNYTKICEYIAQAKQEGYKQLLFILPSKEFSNLYIPISIAVAEHKDIFTKIYSTKTCCYPLAYMATEANRMFESEATLEEVVERLDHIRRNHHIFLFSPTHKDENSGSFYKKYKAGDAYSIENGKISSLLKDKNKTSFEQMLEVFERETSDCLVIPFILYTNKTSKYIALIEEALLKINSYYKRVRLYPIPPTVGIQVGENTIGIGYIVK